MKIDFNYKFKTLDGKVIPERPDEVERDKDGKEVIKKKHPPFTLKTACVNVLLNTDLDQVVCPQCRHQIKVPRELMGEEKANRFMLATKIFNGDGLADIGTKDIELLKDLIAKHYPPLTVGQAWETLDPHEAEEKKKE
ncbi:hypothetical protein ES703_60667 [subsurface metagenome]